jgi:YkoY family integral membrane protein
MWDNLARDLPLFTWYIGVLVFLEGLLSADNALVLALMVRHLSRHDRRRVLQWGIWGAIGFRVVAVLLSTILLKFWFFKVFGGLYLLYLALSHFWAHHKSGGADEAQQSKAQGWLHGFWGTVAAVTVTDIVFSIDSIVTAVAMADDFPDRFGYRGKLFIVLTGGVLGIITMRFVVRYFISLLDRFPGLAEGAYYLVAWIGLKLTISGVSDGVVSFYGEKVHPFHMPDWIFWTGMLVIVILSFLIKPKRSSQESTEATDNLDLLEEPETIANGTSAEDDRGRAKGGSDGHPSSSGPGSDQLDAPPDDHAIAAEHTPEESR